MRYDETTRLRRKSTAKLRTGRRGHYAITCLLIRRATREIIVPPCRRENRIFLRRVHDEDFCTRVIVPLHVVYSYRTFGISRGNEPYACVMRTRRRYTMAPKSSWRNTIVYAVGVRIRRETARVRRLFRYYFKKTPFLSLPTIFPVGSKTSWARICFKYVFSADGGNLVSGIRIRHFMSIFLWCRILFYYYCFII